MDSAKDRYSGQIVSGEELWLITPVDKEGYLCRGCNVPVNPVSFEKGLKIRPHFREYSKYPHKDWCKIEGEKELVRLGRKQRVTQEQGFPGSFPYKLEVVSKKITANDNQEASEYKNKIIKNTHDLKQTSTSQSTSKWIARTIRPICKTYHNFPHDRDLPLFISGLDGSTYGDVIRRLSSQKIVEYKRNHLFYAPISWKKVKKDEFGIIVELSYGYWVDKKLLNPYKIKVNTNGWGQSKINYVLEELEVARHEAMQSKRKNKTTKMKSWLFFIGEQSLTSLNTFIINDHRFICCLTFAF